MHILVCILVVYISKVEYISKELSMHILLVCILSSLLFGIWEFLSEALGDLGSDVKRLSFSGENIMLVIK